MIVIDGYKMDLAISEELTLPGEATKFPAEVGSEFTDHIRDLPLEISLECVVSDTPIGDIASDPTRQRGTDELGNQLPLPSVDALARLREMKARRRLVTIETSLGIFDSMACTEISVPVDKEKSPGTKDTSGALFFTAKFQRVNVVTNKRVKARVRTSMPTGSKTKAATGLVWKKENLYTWRHGIPPGTPWREPNLVEQIIIQYETTSGLTEQEIAEVVGVYVETPLVTYIHNEGPNIFKPIIGVERGALEADLIRDANDKRRRALDAKKELERAAPTLRGVQNLPDGVDLSRFQRPAPPTITPPLPFSDPHL